MIVATAGLSMPAFWFGLLMIYLFSVQLGWFSVIPDGSLKSLVLPAVTLGLIASSIIARLVRSAMLEVLGQDYIRTARAKGLRERRVLLRHALGNAADPGRDDPRPAVRRAAEPGRSSSRPSSPGTASASWRSRRSPSATSR